MQAEPDLVADLAPLPSIAQGEDAEVARGEAGRAGALPLSTIALYGMPAIALGFMGALVALYILKFATDTLLIAPALFGTIFAIAKLWDGVSDPLAGYLSDRTKSRMGRRRPWMLAGALPLALVFVALWSPPAALQGTWLTVWVGAAIVLFYTMFTVVAVPHLALGAELSLDYHERSRVFGGRAFFDFAGFLLAAAAMGLLESADNERIAATSVSAALGVVALILIAISVAKLRERPDFAGRGAHRVDRAMLDVARNPHAVLLLAVFFLDTLGFSCMMVLFPFVTEYVMPGGGSAALYFGVVIVFAFISFPAWAPLSRRFGKRNPWIAANLLKCVAFGSMYFMDSTSMALTWFIVVLMGIVQPAGMILAPSIKADVIDYDEYTTGERKEGAYFATWNLASKLASGIAIFVAGLALQAIGFQPNVDQTEESLLLIRALFAGFPMVLHLVGILLLLRFSFDEAEHARIRKALNERSAALT